MAKICIDAGHGGADAGAVNGKRYEKNDNLEMALKLQNLLTKQGVTVVMTRKTDKDVTLAQRTSLANKEKCNLFLSLHRDSFPNAYGATVYVYSNASTKTYDYGKNILNAVTDMGFASRGVRKGAPNYKDFAVNRDTSMPACLLELGFISSALDNSNFDRKKDTIALAITKAICKQLGITYKDVKAPTVKPVTPYKPTIKEFQKALIKDGYRLPKYGADGYWGNETRVAATNAILKRSVVYRNKNLTAIVQKVVGVKVDGLYGRDTEKAVRVYQKANRLTADGIVGINTYQKMLGVK
ncbi:MAG TPA: N-acetylmuramoyl-L-alanine amidase [Oscillospiraceae bacterium]|nr:N-acetylmuramoyl-L-alanine amidase [Oscillospiraceae bacterium]